MKVHSYEKAFLGVGVVLLAACALALVYASLAMGMRLPGRTAEIDPALVRQTPPFDQPGLRALGPGRYEAVVLGQVWAFLPREIRVPTGSEVTFTATTADVIHGLHVEGTRVNLMLIPGQISRNTYRFDRPGTYNILCHEYCGSGHHTMFSKLIVE